MGGEIERPDLHARDTFGQKIAGQFGRPLQEAAEIIVAIGSRAGQTERRVHIAAPGRVLRAAAGVVDAHAITRGAAEQLVDRHAGRLAHEVPQRDVDRGGRARLDAGTPIADGLAQQRRADLPDVCGVHAEQQGRRDIVHVGFHDGRIEIGFAEADQAGVRLHMHPQQLIVESGAKGFDRGDAHGRAFLPCSDPCTCKDPRTHARV